MSVSVRGSIYAAAVIASTCAVSAHASQVLSNKSAKRLSDVIASGSVLVDEARPGHAILRPHVVYKGPRYRTYSIIFDECREGSTEECADWVPLKNQEVGQFYLKRDGASFRIIMQSGEKP